MTEKTSRRVTNECVRHASRPEELAKASLVINSGSSLSEVIRVLSEKAREIVGAHQSATSLVIDGNWARAVNAVSLSDKYAGWREYDERPDGSGIYRLVFRANRPFRMTQAELEAHPAWRRFGKAAAKHPPMRGWLAAPLAGRHGRNIGLVQLSDKYEGDFTEEDETILVALAQIASVAIERVRSESRSMRRSRKSTRVS